VDERGPGAVPNSRSPGRRSSNPTRRKLHRYDKKLYRQRYRVEVFFHTLKSFRRIATRYEKTSRNDLAIVHLACALQWLKAGA
jgi:transposase